MSFDSQALIDFWFNLLTEYRDLGPIAPIAFVMLESIFPFLPLVLIVTFNISAYGSFYGFVYSLLGNILGSLLVFFIFRFFKHRPIMNRFVHRKRVEKWLNWVLRQHPSFLAFLFSSPFTPSSFINITFGLSGYSKRLFILSMIIGKTFLMLVLLIFGASINVVNEKPYLIVLVLAGYGIVYILSQKYGRLTGEDY